MEKVKTLLVNERYEIHFITDHSCVVYDTLQWTERTKDDRQTGEVFTVNAVVNYSSASYGRMTRLINPQSYLDNRILDKHYKYMYKAINFSVRAVLPTLNTLKGKEFKSVNAFIREYNGAVKKYV